MKKKIAYICKKYQDTNFSTGGEKFNYILIKGLIERGFILDVFTNEIISNKQQLPNKIYNLTQLKEIRTSYNLVLCENGIEPTDITYLHGHSYKFRIKMLSNKFEHIIYKIISPKSHKKRLAEFEKTKTNLQQTKKIVVSSEILKQDVIENFKISADKIEIIPPPLENFRIEKRNNYGEIFTFGISTTGFKRKGGYLALRAIKELKDKNKKFKVKFIYASKNIFVKFLTKFYNIEKYCEFLPIQSDMSNFYNSIDCLLMPSLIEPFGMVATEALSCKIPVITANHCGAAPFIDDGGNGFIYKKNNELKDKMNIILNLNKTEYEKMCLNAFNSVSELYTDNFIQKYIKIIKDLIGE